MEENPKAVRRRQLYYWDADPPVRLYDLESVESLYHETECDCFACERTRGNAMEIQMKHGEVYEFVDDLGVLRTASTEELLKVGASDLVHRRVVHAMKERPSVYKTYEATLDAVLDADPVLKKQYALGL